MLEPQAQAFLDEAALLDEPPIETLTPVQARASSDRMFARRASAGEPVAGIDERAIPGPHGAIPLRIYTPKGSVPFGVLVYFHGGGWTLGSLAMVDPLVRVLANHAGCIVVSVDYRLAPEHQFPVPFDEAYAATQWVVEHAGEFGGDPQRIAVGGDSAGGNLAAAVALAARDRQSFALVEQLLIYPVTDRDFTLPSYTAFADGYMLTAAQMKWFWKNYVRDAAEAREPYAAPLRASSFAGVAPATVVIAGYDPLRDEGEAYAARLREAGITVDVLRYPGMLHGFVTIGGFDRTAEASAACATALRRAFSRARMPDPA